MQMTTGVRSKMFLRIILIGAASLVLAACVGGDRFIETATAPVLLGNAESIAVLPFENRSNSEEAGAVVSDLSVTALRSYTTLAVTPEEAVGQTIDSVETPSFSERQRLPLRQIGEVLGVSYVLTGSVSEYGYQFGLREEPSVSINMRLIEVASGETVWAASSGTVGAGVFSRDSVSIVAHRLVDRMINRMIGAEAVPQ